MSGIKTFITENYTEIKPETREKLMLLKAELIFSGSDLVNSSQSLTTSITYEVSSIGAFQSLLN